MCFRQKNVVYSGLNYINYHLRLLVVFLMNKYHITIKMFIEYSC